MSEIRKPLSVAKEDFREMIYNSVNHSGLPYCIIEDVLKDAYLQIKDLANKQYIAEKRQYEDMLRSQQNDMKNNSEEEI